MREYLNKIIALLEQLNGKAVATAPSQTEKTEQMPSDLATLIENAISNAFAKHFKQAEMPESRKTVESQADELSVYRKLYHFVYQDMELAQCYGQATSFAAFLAKSAQYDLVLHLWEKLHSRCKSEKRTLNQNEMALLYGVIEIHNLANLPIEVLHAEIGRKYNVKNHLSLNPAQAQVSQEYCVGLKLPNGEIKPILIETK